MKTAMVRFDNGDLITTGINGTDEEIREYYSVGKVFNLGHPDEAIEDLMAKVVSVEIEPETNKTGFMFEDKRIHFIDGHGKDISFNRWRVILYYRPGFALPHFLDSQVEYDNFINKYQPFYYEDYSVFRCEKD